MKTKNLEIKCRFCGANGGYVTVDDHRAEYSFQTSEREAQITDLQKEFNKENMTPENISEENFRRQNLIGQISKDLKFYKVLLLDLPQEDPRHNIDFHVEDHRCEKCEAEHGNYKEMSMLVRSYGLPYSIFKEIMQKTGQKKHQLEEHIISYKNKN